MKASKGEINPFDESMLVGSIAMIRPHFSP